MSRKNPSALIALSILSIMTLSACVPENSTPTPLVKSDEKPIENEGRSNVETENKVETKEENTVEPIAAPVDNSEVTFNPLKLLDSKKLLAKYQEAMVKANDETYKPETPTNFSSILPTYSFYDAGEIKIAPYKGQRLVILDLACDGMCMMATIERFALDEKSGELTWLKNLSNDEFTPPHFEALKKNTDEKFSIKALELPNSVMLPDGKNAMNLQQWGLDVKIDKSVNPDDWGFVSLGKVAFNDAKLGPVYFAEALIGALYVVGPDGVISSYTYDNGLLAEKNWQEIKFPGETNPTVITGEYSGLTRGCGIGMSGYYVEEVMEDQLVEIGKTSKGIKLYEVKNKERLDFGEENKNYAEFNKTMPGTVSLNQAYESYEAMYEYRTEEHKNDPLLTYEQFLDLHPILYWQDPFGRYSGIIKNDVKPAAECGKPVIYLYPEKTATVSVKVDIEEFTKTVPAYNNGWEVVAKPNGELTNLADGKNYPYLFWEGITKKELAMTGGFVIAKAELENFLDNSLAKMGLNEQESKDFTEFWLPKMQASDGQYLLISFVGTQEFNKVAPLEISPKPDTLIRVFMYYQPLQAPVKIQPQKLSSIARNGFTVVEWGGTSSDGWQTK